MSEEKTKVLIPFRQPIAITNPTQPGEEEGEVVPVPIHIIVDNAADFPCGGGGGGGGVARVGISDLCNNLGNLVLDEESGYIIAINSNDGGSEGPLSMFDYSYDLDPSAFVIFLIPNDTPFHIDIMPITSGAYFVNDLTKVIVVIDDDGNDITDQCQQYPGHWEIDAEYGFITIPGLSIPSGVDIVHIEIGTQK